MKDDISEDIFAETTAFENSFYERVAAAKEFLEMLDNKPAVNSFTASDPSCDNYLCNSMSNCLIKLPTIMLPKFSGIYTKWREFKDTFEASIESAEGLSNIQKFYYLRASL